MFFDPKIDEMPELLKPGLETTLDQARGPGRMTLSRGGIVSMLRTVLLPMFFLQALGPGCTESRGLPPAIPTGAHQRGTTNGPPVAFTVRANQSQYASDPLLFTGTGLTTVEFTATLQNVSTDQVTVSGIALTNISVVSVRHQGNDLIPVTVKKVSFDDDPSAAAARTLVTLAPQEKIQFTIFGLSTLTGGGGVPFQEQVFQPAGAGRYSVTFQYQYSGPDNGRPNVFHGTLVDRNVSFHVQ